MAQITTLKSYGFPGGFYSTVSTVEPVVCVPWEDTYELIAYSFDATFTDRHAGAYYIKQAMFVISDLVTCDENATEAATILLPKIKKFYNWILHYWDIDETRKLAIYEINKFTEKYHGDLTVFVNGISWVDGCVPYYWAETSENSSFDTSGWIVCS